MNAHPHPATLERYLRNLIPVEQEILRYLRLGSIVSERAIAGSSYFGDLGDARKFLRVCEHLGLVTRLIVEDYADVYTAGPILDDVILGEQEASGRQPDRQ